MSRLQPSQLRSATNSRQSLRVSTTESYSGLLACSNEVLDIIFGEPSLSKKDMKSLRLTCKEIYPAATREFAKRYFTNLVVVLSLDSLWSLVGICEHPLFSPHVLSIGFLTTRMTFKKLRRDADRISDWRDPIALADTLASIGKHAKLCKEQIQLESFGAKNLLVKAFSALKHPFTIKFTNAPESMDLVEVLGLPRIAYNYDRSTGKRCCDPAYDASKMESLSGLVQEAIGDLSDEDRKSFTSLEYHIRVLTVIGTGSGDCIGHVRTDAVYPGLTSLHLEMDIQSLRNKESFTSLEQLFKAAPNLQESAFKGGCTGKRIIGQCTVEPMTKICQIETKFGLRVLTLENVACSPKSLLQLLERHKHTLISIRLLRVTLLGSWPRILTWVRKELDLVEFHIDQVYRVEARPDGTAMPKPQNLTKTCLKGKENTQVGLDSLIKLQPRV